MAEFSTEVVAFGVATFIHSQAFLADRLRKLGQHDLAGRAIKNGDVILEAFAKATTEEQLEAVQALREVPLEELQERIHAAQVAAAAEEGAAG